MSPHAAQKVIEIKGLLAATTVAGALSLLAACSNQAAAYSSNPMCRQAKQKCELYYNTMERTKTDRGAGIDLLREDCEASQRGCSESVSRSLESSAPQEPGKRKTSYWDY